jgi:AraC family transcriptional regulator, arabinose operon regulatory protein
MIDISEQDYIQTSYYAKIKCEPSWVWREREKPLENFDLFYVWEGQGTLTVNQEVYHITRGSCLLFRPGDYTSATHDAKRPLTLTYVHFSLSEVPARIPQRYRQLADPLEIEPILARYVRLRLEPSFGADQETRLILKQLMILLLRDDRHTIAAPIDSSATLHEAIRETAQYMREHPALWPTLSTLAARAGLSHKYYSMKFKSIMGETVQNYMIRSRIERAEYLLRFSGMYVSEVADALGYRDVFFFSRQFKRHTGRNPSELR